jgi:hypothetical protein
VRKSPASKDVVEDTVRIHYQETDSENNLRRLSTCCGELQNELISDTAIITCSDDL